MSYPGVEMGMGIHPDRRVPRDCRPYALLHGPDRWPRSWFNGMDCAWNTSPLSLPVCTSCRWRKSPWWRTRRRRQRTIKFFSFTVDDIFKQEGLALLFGQSLNCNRTKGCNCVSLFISLLILVSLPASECHQMLAQVFIIGHVLLPRKNFIEFIV